ncbi:adenine-specific methyltransferase EcoRI family protein [Caldifermentibacillus hisashii]|uniref:adenine-specific methyltransferase EcoRI family protein n=1 Tax=Caldifermentibacillus hisashii TaxID=996558 RepID=UPI003CC725BD
MKKSIKKYDNYDAIKVSKVDEIPKNYSGVRESGYTVVRDRIYTIRAKHFNMC